MNAKDNATPTTWFDPDDAPELTDKWFEAAHQYQGDTLIKRGRGRPPISENERKVPVKIRYDQDVIETFRKTGKGWQTRMNQALRQYLKEHNVSELK
ncbi:BrnA antitoxin family protein [Halomonas llamarensis]|uniref:BrnA antitoxin family protein n=1 Tax=Halomonas llamarensis TaxID=2945104 RepID=A0ABT0SLJ4_9GAMM|nr:BrnA antitoxin family protein [Halomonas llamarensis]MCL7928676.1 BrnA antitoxin family protein [Halomonas llamarensis]